MLVRGVTPALRPWSHRSGTHTASHPLWVGPVLGGPSLWEKHAAASCRCRFVPPVFLRAAHAVSAEKPVCRFRSGFAPPFQTLPALHPRRAQHSLPTTYSIPLYISKLSALYSSTQSI